MHSTDDAALSREQALEELAFLASVEHALCVEYLLVHCALGHNLAPADDGDVARRVGEAAASASALAQSEMRHLHNVNRALTAAGRPPSVSRAASIGTESGAELPLAHENPAADEHFVARAQSIAAAVDERYARLRRAVSSQPPLFEGAVLEQLLVVLGPGPEHVAGLASLAHSLAGLSAEQYLRARRVPPRDDVERSLLRLSDATYGLIVAAIEAWFAHEDELGGVLRNRAISLMDVLDELNGLLVERGLVPSFTPVASMP